LSLAAACLGLGIPARAADGVVVFNEVSYRSPDNQPAGEWIELYNQMAVDVDLSGWTLSGGVEYAFPEGTTIAGGGYLVVAAAPGTLASAAGLANVVGPFVGRLSNQGDSLRLRNRDQRVIDEMDYGVEGDWPVAPNGSGVTLAKEEPNAASSPARNWTASARVGGTPGARNFAATPFTLTQSVPVALGAGWRYDGSGLDLGTYWSATSYDDTDWASGSALFRAGTVSPPDSGAQPIPTLFSTGQADTGAVLTPGSADPHYLLTLSAQATPPPPPIAATVILNHPAWAANDTASSWIGCLNPGELNVAEGSYNFRTAFSLDGFDPASARLSCQVGADNRLTNILLNGVAKGIAYAGFSTLSGSFAVTNGFVAGTNTLEFLTVNDPGPGANPGGFRARVSGTANRRYPVQTPLPESRTNYYFRTRFILDGEPQQAALTLGTIVADGAVFYLNGTEVLRLNLPSGPVTAQTFARSNVAKPTYLGPYSLPNTALQTGTNVLAVEVHTSAGTPRDVLFGADLSLTVTNVLIPPAIPLAFNEFASATNADFWIELINHGRSPVDLGGCFLVRQGTSASREYVLPAQLLAPGACTVLSRATLGFGADPGDSIFLYRSGRSGVLDAVVAKRDPRARLPDGTGPWWHPTELTPGLSNRFVLRDEIVFNEIMYHAPAPTTGATNAVESWLELHNRSGYAVDLAGWRLAHDIDFAFPPTTTVPAGGYLVVAKDPALAQALHPGLEVLGPFDGNLRRRGSHLQLLDPAGNPADECRYYDRKPWPESPDGGGASLELRNPWADRNRPEAWAASDESRRSVWSNYTYRATASNAFGPTLWKEFVLGLLDAGECLIDDIHVVESPTGTRVEFLQNGTFENGLVGWRLLGDHSRSHVEVDPDNPANHVLHLVATGPTEHIHNHLETTFASGRSVTDGRQYEIAFRARWLAGNNRLNTRLYFNRVARTTELPRPNAYGTPGAVNSTFVANPGPTFTGLAHSPVVPQPSEVVRVAVNVADPQGLGSVLLRWSANGGTWNENAMLPSGPGTDPGYVAYVATIPAQAAGTVVQFYVSATDSRGASAVYPAGGADSRALYKVSKGENLMNRLHRFRLVMRPVDAEFLHAHTNVMSLEPQGLTLVYDETEVFYDVSLHLQSSERGRDSAYRVGFTIRLNADHLFRGTQDTLTLDRSGGWSGIGGRHDEVLLWHAVNHAGGILGYSPDLAQCFAPRSQEDSTAILRMAAFDGGYFDDLYPDGSDGNLYTLELIYYPTTTATGDPQAPKLPQPDDVLNVEIQDRGADRESYRWIFLQENHAELDDYSGVIALNKAFSLTGTALETQTRQIMDIDQWMRTLAFKAFTGDVDTFSYGLNHNWKIFFRPTDGRALGLLWDMDYSFVQAINYASPGSGSANMYKIARLANNQRRFSHHLLDILTTTVNRNYLAPWAAHYAGLVGENWNGPLDYLVQRADYLRSTLPLNTPFAITLNSGNNLTTGNSNVTLTGTAPLPVGTIAINGQIYTPTWTTLTNWSVPITLPARVNPLSVQGLDDRLQPIAGAVDSIVITNIGALALKPIVINEWLADNSAPGGFFDPVGARYSDWIELFNPNPVPINVGGYLLSDSLAQPGKWSIPTNTVIAASGFLLVWADGLTNLNTAGATVLHADFQLAKGGEAIVLLLPDGRPQHAITFGPQAANIAQGLYPDGETNTVVSLPDWTPRAPNRTGQPAAPQVGVQAVPNERALAFTISTLVRRTYRLEYKDDLNAPLWLPAAPNQTATTATLTLTQPVDTAPQRFYRVVLVP
jgi:hypothetical protein